MEGARLSAGRMIALKDRATPAKRPIEATVTVFATMRELGVSFKSNLEKPELEMVFVVEETNEERLLKSMDMATRQ